MSANQTRGIRWVGEWPGGNYAVRLLFMTKEEFKKQVEALALDAWKLGMQDAANVIRRIANDKNDEAMIAAAIAIDAIRQSKKEL